MKFFRNLARTLKEGNPRFSYEDITQALLTYGNVTRLYRQFEDEVNEDKIREDTISTLSCFVEEYELDVPSEVRKRVDARVAKNYTIQEIKRRIAEAKR